MARLLAPLVLAVLDRLPPDLVLAGQQLTILHLVGMLLIVAVGSNYALFFDGEGLAAEQRTLNSALILASLVIANMSTVIGFGPAVVLLQVPVLVALQERRCSPRGIPGSAFTPHC